MWLAMTYPCCRTTRTCRNPAVPEMAESGRRGVSWEKGAKTSVVAVGTVEAPAFRPVNLGRKTGSFSRGRPGLKARRLIPGMHRALAQYCSVKAYVPDCATSTTRYICPERSEGPVFSCTRTKQQVLRCAQNDKCFAARAPTPLTEQYWAKALCFHLCVCPNPDFKM
jgi:hypothetical protein